MSNLDVGFVHGSIRLEQIPPVYYSGQTVVGSVIFDLRQPLKFSSLSIHYIGEANVLWTENETVEIHGVEQQRQREFKTHEVYFNGTEILAGVPGTVSELPPTHQAFPFKFKIPHTCPSSFNGEYGGVSYSITATMVYPNMSQEQIKQQIKVVFPVNLNTLNPALKEPTELVFSDELTGCCVSWNSNTIKIRVTLPVTGYCPGQTIPVRVDVDNTTSTEITKIIFEILTRERYHSRQPPSEYTLPEKVLGVTTRGAVLSNTKKSFTVEMVVPDMMPVYLDKCTCIDVGYFFRATFNLSGCNDPLQDESEICLGLIPVEGTVQGRYVHPMAHELPSVPIPDPPVFTEPEPNVNGNFQNMGQNDNPPPYPGLNPTFPTQEFDQLFKASNQLLNAGFASAQNMFNTTTTNMSSNNGRVNITMKTYSTNKHEYPSSAPSAPPAPE